ncbi:MAG: ABC transporter permease [Actinomycetota bacterium]
MSDIAISRPGLWGLRALFAATAIFLYAPILILVLFSFNRGTTAVFPIQGLTTDWYRQLFTNHDLIESLRTSALVAVLSSVTAVLLGVLMSLSLVRRRFLGKSVVTGVALAPLVMPYVVLGISLLILFNAAGIPLSIFTVTIAHVVVTLPFTVLILVPRLSRVDRSLEEAAQDLGAPPARTFLAVTLPLILPAVVSSFLIAFVVSFDEYVVASFLVGDRATYPIYLFSQLRFPNRLPQVLAVATVMLVVSFVIVLLAEVSQRFGEQRLLGR